MKNGWLKKAVPLVGLAVLTPLSAFTIAGSAIWTPWKADGHRPSPGPVTV